MMQIDLYSWPYDVYSPPTQHRAQRQAMPKRQMLRVVASWWLLWLRWSSKADGLDDLWAQIMVHYEVKYKVEFAWKESCCSLTLTQKIFFLGFKQQMYYSSVKSYDGIESHASKILVLFLLTVLTRGLLWSWGNITSQIVSKGEALGLELSSTTRV